MTTHTDCWKTPSAEKNSGRKLELSGRDRRALQSCARTAAANVTADLDTHLKDSVSTKTVRQELHKSNIQGRAATAKPLITVSTAKRRKR